MTDSLLPKVSVITICRNSESGLRATRESLEQQTYPALEHVIIDAASIDGTQRYLRSLPGDVCWLSERDNGRYDGMNKGGRMSTGELLWFMNAGDRFARADTIELVASLYTKMPFSWAYGLARLVDPNGDVKAVAGDVPFSFPRFVLGDRPVPHQASVYTRALFEQLNGFRTDAGLAADQEFFMRACRLSGPTVIPEILCDFDTSGAGSHRSVWAHYRDMRQYRKDNDVVVYGQIRDMTLCGALLLRSWLIALGRRRSGRRPG